MSDIAALSYLLPLVLIVDIGQDSALALTFHMIGGLDQSYLSVAFLIKIVSTVITYGIVLRVVDQVYFASGWRRVLHATGYVIIVPVLLAVLSAAFFIVPVTSFYYAVQKPTRDGEDKLKAGDYEAAEKLFRRAIENDVTATWSAHARIRFVSANARRILKLLPRTTSDSGMRERLLRHFAQTEPFQRVIRAWRPEGPIQISPAQLIEFREAILHSFLSNRDIPVTTSELECALRPTAVDDGCDDLPKDVVAKYEDSPAQRQRLYYLMFRARALRGEPTTVDVRRYFAFLFELPIRIEIMYVRYHALNLAREGKTLAYLDDQDRFGIPSRGQRISGNKKILVRGDKFPHLKMSDVDMEKLSDQELGFEFRQVYLNYLRTESRLLAASRVSSESSLIQHQVASIEEQLKWVANDVLYRDIPSQNPLEQAIRKLFGKGD
jgi:hypothetical protein